MIALEIINTGTYFFANIGQRFSNKNEPQFEKNVSFSYDWLELDEHSDIITRLQKLKIDRY